VIEMGAEITEFGVVVEGGRDKVDVK